MSTILGKDQCSPAAHRSRRLMQLAWILSALVLLAMWTGVSEGLRQRQALLQAQQQTQQAEWLRLASAGADDRLRTLAKELQLFSSNEPSLARDATMLSPLIHGQLWLVNQNMVQQLRGPARVLGDEATQQTRQWLSSPIAQPRLAILPSPSVSRDASESDLLQLVLPLCREDVCDSALTGLLRVRDLLDPEMVIDHPPFALLDIHGTVLASKGQIDLSKNLSKQAGSARLTQVPLSLAANYQSQHLIRNFNLFAISLLGGALLLSSLILLLMFRVNQLLRHVEANNLQLSHAQDLLVLSNSSLREKMRQLIDEQRDQQTLIETVQVGVMIVDAQELSILTSNDAAARMLGMSRQVLQRQALPALFHSEGRCHELLQVLQEQQIVSDREAQLEHSQHKTCWSMMSMRYLQFRERHAIAISLIDITDRIAHAQRLQDEKQATESALAQLQATQHELYQRATLDDLTGLANRRHFLSFASKSHERARLENKQIAVALIDLDYFKKINDSYGHAAGDAALQHFAKNLRLILPEGIMAGRMGGEEFALLLPDTTLQGAYELVDNLRTEISGRFFYADEHALKLSFSAGVAISQPGQSLPELLKHADKSLYEAKASGRNCVLRASE